MGTNLCLARRISETTMEPVETWDSTRYAGDNEFCYTLHENADVTYLYLPRENDVYWRPNNFLFPRMWIEHYIEIEANKKTLTGRPRSPGTRSVALVL